MFGKRVIVVGGGAQVAQVALGAVSEADRHNLRGERISVDTIPLVGEENIAAAVRAVADLPRARLLVLAGSIMGGDITRAARELREHGIPIIALNMVGSITERGRPRRVGPGPGRDDGGDGHRRHGDVRPRPPARPAVLTGPDPTDDSMRIATWNVNSLKARLEKVEWWLERAAPDVLLMQETKLARRRRAGDGVRDGRLRPRPPRRGPLERRRDRRPPGHRRRRTSSRTSATARSATAARGRACPSRGGLRPVRRGADGQRRRRPAGAAAGRSGSSACTRRTAGSSARRSTTGKLRWYERLARWLARGRRPDEPLVIGGDFNIAPTDADVWDAARRPRRHPRLRARARGVPGAPRLGPRRRLSRAHDTEPGRFTWWDYRAGNFHKNFGMRIDHLLATAPVADAGRLGRDRPRGAQGHADPVGPRPARRRPRRARPAVRRRTGPARCRGSRPGRARPGADGRGRSSRLRADALRSAIGRAQVRRGVDDRRFSPHRIAGRRVPGRPSSSPGCA